MKKLRFKKGIWRVNIPFILNPVLSWREQVEKELEKYQRQYGTSKCSEWGYKIENGNAEIYITKIKSY